MEPHSSGLTKKRRREEPNGDTDEEERNGKIPRRTSVSAVMGI